VALKEALSLDAIGSPDDRTRAPLEMLNHPIADTFKIIRKIKFSDRAFSLIGP
jgi:hypothetical protein